MATIKSYSDLQQSKKLAEILPLESADMMYHSVENEYGSGAFVATSKVITNELENDDFYIDDIPCWSLASLLSVLPKTFNYNNHTYQFLYNTHAMFYINVDNYDEDTFCSTNENLVDACYEIIIKLHEQNLI